MGRKAGLAPFEIIEGVVLTDGEWSSMNVSCDSNENGRSGRESTELMGMIGSAYTSSEVGSEEDCASLSSRD